jgi:D-alanine-D-alanine ligase
MQRTTVLLLFGGESSEHDVSVSSARNVYAAIDDTKYEVLLGYIDTGGKWWLVNELDGEVDMSNARQLVAELGNRCFITTPDDMIVAPDVILPILHGKNGEDGTVQGLAQLLHIPIVGCDMTSSVLAMDKIASKEIFYSHGLKILPYKVHHQGEELLSFDDLRRELGGVMFVKPSRAGSSVGVYKVTSQPELDNALVAAHEHDEFVLIEKAADHPRELEVAVIGMPPHHKASGVGEIRPDGDFYSYDSKYDSSSQSQIIIPAEIASDVAAEIRQQALKAYAALKCRGLARVDFFLDQTGELYINEINTLPGFTNISMYPKLWREEGLSYGELIDRLITSAL